MQGGIMNTLSAIMVALGSCFGGSGCIAYRCYVTNRPQEEQQQQTATQLTQHIHNEAPVIQRQPTPPLEHIIKEAVKNMRDSDGSDTEVDIKIHVQSKKDAKKEILL